MSVRVATKAKRRDRVRVLYVRYSQRWTDAATRYKTASAIKWVSAVTLLAVWDESRSGRRWRRPVDLDAPLRDFVPSFRDAVTGEPRRGDMTLRALFSHTSNLSGAEPAKMRDERLQDFALRVATGRSGLARPPRDPVVPLLTLADFPSYTGPKAGRPPVSEIGRSASA